MCFAKILCFLIRILKSGLPLCIFDVFSYLLFGALIFNHLHVSKKNARKFAFACYLNAVLSWMLY